MQAFPEIPAKGDFVSGSGVDVLGVRGKCRDEGREVL
jgi:hypothetical protein